jgi:VWFA-related protein
MRVSLFLVVLLLAVGSLVRLRPAFGQDQDKDKNARDAQTGPQTTGPQAKDNGGQEGVIRSQVDLVSVYFTVRDDKKRLASELPQDRFSVSEDGHQQAIKFFAHHSDVVLNVGVLLDTGTNMSWVLGEEAQASAMFMKHVVRPTDLGFILSYASRVETVQLPTSDVARLEEKAATVRAGEGAIGLPDQGPGPVAGPPITMPGGGGTVGINGQPLNLKREAHLYDAIRVSTLRYLSHEVGRKAVVIVALSSDSKSESSMEEALEALLENDVIAYVLQIYDPPHERMGRDHCDVVHTYDRDDHGEYLLKKLAEATGGRMLEVHGTDKLAAALDEISDELHHQYSLGYYPENKHWDGKFRKIQISAGEKGYRVYARKGYYGNRPGGSVASTH